MKTKTPEEIVLVENRKGTVSYLLHRTEDGRICIDVFDGIEWKQKSHTHANHEDFYFLSTDIIYIDER